MRTSILALACWLAASSNSAYADEISRIWMFPPSAKPIIVTKDFCEICNCCIQIETFPYSKGDLPTSFGTTDFPQMMKDNMVDAWQELEPKLNTMPPETSEDLLSGAGIRTLRDMCEICECCEETPDALILNRGMGVMPNLQDYRVFAE